MIDDPNKHEEPAGFPMPRDMKQVDAPPMVIITLVQSDEGVAMNVDWQPTPKADDPLLDVHKVAMDMLEPFKENFQQAP